LAKEGPGSISSQMLTVHRCAQKDHRRIQGHTATLEVWATGGTRAQMSLKLVCRLQLCICRRATGGSRVHSIACWVKPIATAKGRTTGGSGVQNRCTYKGPIAWCTTTKGPTTKFPNHQISHRTKYPTSQNVSVPNVLHRQTSPSNFFFVYIWALF
jgi:hypothetical protein